MKNAKSFAAYGIPIVVFLMLVSCSPSPESYAGATATLMKANSIQTTDAIEHNWAATVQAGTVTAMQAQGTQTAEAAQVAASATAVVAQAQASATAAALAVQVHATETAIPYQGSTAGANATSSQLMAYAPVILVVVVVLLGLAIAEWRHNRNKIVPRDKSTGQAQPVMIGDTIVDLQRQIGAATTVRRPTFADYFMLIWKGVPLPATTVQTTDAGADADHLLAAAQSANATTAVGALMRPNGLDDKGRAGRVEMTSKVQGAGMLGGGSSFVKVVGFGDDVSEEFVRQFAHTMGDAIPEPPTITVAPPSTAAAIPPGDPPVTMPERQPESEQDGQPRRVRSDSDEWTRP